jgi:beta-glucanase (GH16 family)
MKAPNTMGTWPAIYLLQWDDYWPPEIDVMEATGRVGNRVFANNHCVDDYGRVWHSDVNIPPDGLDRRDWHTYAICWEPGRLAWYIDGVYKGTTRPVEVPPPSVPMYIRLNLAVGSWGGDLSQAVWPTDMDVDLMRVYQRADLPLPLYPERSIETTLPAGTVTLSAITCNPLTAATVKWTLAEGPSGATIQNPDALVTQATVTKPGMYRFNVNVTKGSSTASRDLLVYVNPSLERQ